MIVLPPTSIDTRKVELRERVIRSDEQSVQSPRTTKKLNSSKASATTRETYLNHLKTLQSACCTVIG